MNLRSCGWTLIIAGGMAAPLPSQVRLMLDAGVSGTPRAGRGTVGYGSLAPRLRYESDRWRLEAIGEYRDLGPARRILGASGSLSRFVPLGGGALIEFTGHARGWDGLSRVSGIVWDAGGRLHLGGQQRGVQLGLMAGAEPHGTLLRWEGSLWRRLGPATIQIFGSQSATAVSPGANGRLSDSLTPTDTATGIRAQTTTDVGAWLRWAKSRFEIELGLGRRYGVPDIAQSLQTPGDGGGAPVPRQRSRWSGWWLADLTWWLNPWIGLRGAIGASPPDPHFGAESGRFLRFGIRASLRRGPEGRPRGAVAAGLGFKSRRLSEALVRLHLRLDPAIHAAVVELMGDFTDWLPVRLERRGRGEWQTALAVAPGVHQVNIRLDGGAWRPPPGTPDIPDEFGTETGLLIVD